jgi:tRNA(Ile2) C34 agmatinyltransferase TiaS
MTRLYEVVWELLYCANCGRRTEWAQGPHGWYCTRCNLSNGGDR